MGDANIEFNIISIVTSQSKELSSFFEILGWGMEFLFRKNDIGTSRFGYGLYYCAGCF